MSIKPPPPSPVGGLPDSLLGLAQMMLSKMVANGLDMSKLAPPTHWRKVWTPEATLDPAKKAVLNERLMVVLNAGPFTWVEARLKAVRVAWTPIKKTPLLCSPELLQGSFKWDKEMVEPFDPRKYLYIELKFGDGRVLTPKEEAA